MPSGELPARESGPAVRRWTGSVTSETLRFMSVCASYRCEALIASAMIVGAMSGQ